MNRYFRFRWRPSEDDAETVLVLAATSSTFDRNEVQAILDAENGSDLRPDRLLFAIPASDGHEAYAEALRETVLGEQTLRLPVDRTTISIAPYDVAGTCQDLVHVSGPAVHWEPGDFDRLCAAGLLEIFGRRDVLVRSLPGTHFVHPRGVHSLSFLRGANAFVSGAEVGFIAITLLRHLRGDVVQIWLDTSSIASVAYALMILRKQLDPAFVPPHVDSFSSYDGLPTTRFENPRRSLFLISATASGNMAREIASRDGIGREQVVNVFSSAPTIDDITVHCDVRDQPCTKAQNGESLLGTYPAATCPWCRDESRLVRFVSEQFLADHVETKSILVREDHAPKGTKETFARLRQRGMFALRDDGEGDSHRFHLSVDAIRDDPWCVDRLRAAVSRHAPVGTSHVVSAGDEESDVMAERVAGLVGERSRDRPIVVRAVDVRDLTPGTVGGVVVVAACIGSGLLLQDVSRDLRDVMGDEPRTYLVGIEKHAERRRSETLLNDLAHHKVFRNHVVPLVKLVLPEKGVTAWAAERRLLQGLAAAEEDLERARFMEDRLETLLAERIGGVGDCFLPTPGGGRLQLRPGFAFWDGGYDPARVSHGDVLATVSTVLHNMRTDTSKGPDPELSSNPFRAAVLAPETFARYNDGVIQAAFLRSARPHELNYGNEPALSATMLRLIRRTLDRWRDGQGEAILEFLLAIAAGRLVLADADQRRLARTPPPAGAPAPLLAMFAAAVRDRSGGRA